MKKSLAYSIILSLSLCVLIGHAGYCSGVGKTVNYDIALVEKQASLTEVIAMPVYDLRCNVEVNYGFINQGTMELRADQPLSPVKAKGLISATHNSYSKRYWLIPFKIKPGSLEYEYLTDLIKTKNVQSTGLIEKPVKIPSKC